MSHWFICHNENVVGPFTVDEIKDQVHQGLLGQECLVWGRGQGDWVSVGNWIKLSDSYQASEVQNHRPEQMWHYAIEGDSKGPMSRGELILELSNIRNKDQILVWTKGMTAWADLFEFHDLLDELGLNKREHPRAPIRGAVVITPEDGAPIIAQLKTVSAGGVGATNVNQSLSMGQNVTLEIKSDSLNETISVKAQVQYVTELGFVGFKFQSISMEAKSRILQYLRSAKGPAQQAA